MLKHRVYFQAFQARWLLADSHALQQLDPSSPRICREKPARQSHGKAKNKQIREATTRSNQKGSKYEQRTNKHRSRVPKAETAKVFEWFAVLSAQPQSTITICHIHNPYAQYAPYATDEWYANYLLQEGKFKPAPKYQNMHFPVIWGWRWNYTLLLMASKSTLDHSEVN